MIGQRGVGCAFGCGCWCGERRSNSRARRSASRGRRNRHQAQVAALKGIRHDYVIILLLSALVQAKPKTAAQAPVVSPRGPTLSKPAPPPTATSPQRPSPGSTGGATETANASSLTTSTSPQRVKKLDAAAHETVTSSNTLPSSSSSSTGSSSLSLSSTSPQRVKKLDAAALAPLSKPVSKLPPGAKAVLPGASAAAPPVPVASSGVAVAPNVSPRRSTIATPQTTSVSLVSKTKTNFSPACCDLR